MGKKSPPSSCQGKNQPTMLNFFTKKENQQSKLFTHITRGAQPTSTHPKKLAANRENGSKSSKTRLHGTVSASEADRTKPPILTGQERIKPSVPAKKKVPQIPGAGDVKTKSLLKVTTGQESRLSAISATPDRRKEPFITGSEFHNFAAATEDARSPSLILDDLTSSSSWDCDLRLPAVIPETPESCVLNNDRNLDHITSIAETPPAVLVSNSEEDELLDQLLKETKPAISKRSKLSRRYKKQPTNPKSCPSKKLSSNGGDDNFEIKPTKILSKKLGTKLSRTANFKRSPQRGVSPQAKRPQVHINGENDSAQISARKHLFDAFTENGHDLKTAEKGSHNVFSDGRMDASSDVTKSSGSPIPNACEDRVANLSSGVTCQNENNATTTMSSLSENHDHENVSPSSQEKSHSESEAREVLSDMTNTLGNKSMDVEWDDLNESLLAAMEEEDFLEQGGSKTPSVKSVQGRPINSLAQLSLGGKTPEALLPADLARFKVLSVRESNNSDKLLHVQNLSTGISQRCTVSGVWSQLSYTEGAILAIHGDWNDAGECHISQDQGFVIYNPDLLLTGTAVSNSIRCMRRSVLGELFKGIDKGNKAMVLGTMVHEVFDKALRNQKFDEASLKKYAALSSGDPSFRDKLYSMRMKEADVLKDIEEYYKPIQTWVKKYLRTTPQTTVDIKWPGTMSSVKSQVAIPRITDIEDNIWSPRWGIKGKVDVTTEVTINRRIDAKKPDTYKLPLELKTGRQTNSIEHHSQVMLYSLMMADLDPQVPPLGLLLYLKTGSLHSVTASHMDKRELIHLRNQLAFYLSKRADTTGGGLAPPELPPPIEDDFTCGRCAHATSCAIMNRLQPRSSPSESGVAFFEEQISHLSDTHVQYFHHWYSLFILESEEIRRKNPTRDLWNKPVEERERKGSCCGNLVVKKSQQEESGGYKVTFAQKERSSPIKFAVGDWVIVSTSKRRIAKQIGTVKIVTDASVTISTDGPLRPYPANPAIYVMDINESFNSMASSFVNLAGLMSHTAHMSHLRGIIVDLASPSYDDPSDPSLSPNAEAILRKLNTDQQSAIVRVLQSHDYTLIMGMPGTGKTTTVTALVRILVLEGKSVLLTSYTHSAVDNILLKLEKVGVTFLRLGSSYRIHQQLLNRSEETALKGLNVDQVTSILESMPVIAATSLGVKSPLLAHKHFDFCIIDEASQISQPVCLAPLFRASKFVLVGDHKQLPPLIQSPQARLHGMDESLFQRLASSHPESVTKLGLQYRMHPLIMEISNEYTYEGALQCGSHREQSKLLELRQSTASVDGWLQKAVDPNTVVQLFSTEELPMEDCGSSVNEVEARLVKQTVQLLIKSGCEPKGIGIIAPFRKQCHLLQTLVDPVSADIEVNTVDKYQGRDKSVILVSFTLQKDSGQSILEDARRINVAITRAKKKLLMFGNAAVLRPAKSVGTLVKILDEKGLVSVIRRM